MKALNDISLDPRDQAAIEQASVLLKERFPVESVVLFGSKARGTDDPESDIDLLVLTSRELSRLEHRALLEALYDIQLQHDVLLSPLVVLRTDWEAGLYSVLPLHFEIDRDGVTA